MWKLKILREINFPHKPWIWNWWICDLPARNFQKIKIEGKWWFLRPFNLPKLISRKIWVAEKFIFLFLQLATLTFFHFSLRKIGFEIQCLFDHIKYCLFLQRPSQNCMILCILAASKISGDSKWHCSLENRYTTSNQISNCPCYVCVSQIELRNFHSIVAIVCFDCGYTFQKNLHNPQSYISIRVLC